MKCCMCNKNERVGPYLLCLLCIRAFQHNQQAFVKKSADQPTPNIRGDNRPGMAAKAAVAK